jgi:hypothetical protein
VPDLISKSDHATRLVACSAVLPQSLTRHTTTGMLTAGVTFTRTYVSLGFRNASDRRRAACFLIPTGPLVPWRKRGDTARTAVTARTGTRGDDEFDSSRKLKVSRPSPPVPTTIHRQVIALLRSSPTVVPTVTQPPTGHRFFHPHLIAYSHCPHKNSFSPQLPRGQGYLTSMMPSRVRQMQSANCSITHDSNSKQQLHQTVTTLLQQQCSELLLYPKARVNSLFPSMRWLSTDGGPTLSS